MTPSTDLEDLQSEIRKCRICKEKFGFESHPSPLNIKWLRGHPDFMNSRVIEIEHKMHEVLYQ